MDIEVVRSKRRRKTVELKPTPAGVRITIPASASEEDERYYVSTLVERWKRKQARPPLDLQRKAAKLAAEYRLKEPLSIKWVDNQKTRWGSCTPSSGSIRISSSVAKFPAWVIDYVVIHEMAHLSYLSHGPRFWSLVERYPLTERARGFLIAKGLEGEDDENDDVGVDVDAEDSTVTNTDEVVDPDTTTRNSLSDKDHRALASLFDQDSVFSPSP